MPVRQPPGASGSERIPLRLRCNLRFAALVIVSLPLLITLGFWQLARAVEKEDALRLAQTRRLAPPVSIDKMDPSAGSGLDDKRVLLEGRYLAERAFLLDNRILQGQVGYELLMPFRDAKGITVIVNRGWIKAPPTREELPTFETPGEHLHLQGRIHVPASAALPDTHATPSWPTVIQAVNVPDLARLAGLEAFPFVVRLNPEQPGVTNADWPTVNMDPDRHRAYAAQWFLMAIALLVVFVTGGTNIRAWLAAHRKKARQS
jgi:cytochrome oxidase assembly protein ShyY1